jgi:hypothetical protein
MVTSEILFTAVTMKVFPPPAAKKRLPKGFNFDSLIEHRLMPRIPVHRNNIDPIEVLP